MTKRTDDQPGGPRRVEFLLIAEDNAVEALVRRAVSARGHDLIVARTAAQARSMLSAQAIAAVLLDVASSPAVFADLAGPTTPPLLFLRTGSSPAEVSAATGRGAADVLPAPLSAEAIGCKLDVFAALLHQRIRIQELEAKDAAGPGIQDLRTIFASMDTALVVIEVLFDENGRGFDYRLLEMNSAYEAQSGLARAVGKTRRELTPDHEEHWFETFGRVATSGEPVRFVSEARIARRWFDVLAVPLGPPGCPRLACLFSDVTARIRAENDARDARARMEATLRAGEVATWTWDTRADRVFANENMRELFSLSKSEAEGGPIEVYRRAIHPEDRERVDETMARALERAEPYEIEYRVLTSAGRTRWIIARARPEFDEDGQAERLSGVVLDITRQKSAEAELSSKTDRLNLLIENIRDYAVIVTDPTGVVLEWEGGAERIIGYSAAEVVGTDLHMMFTPEDQAAHVPDLERIHADELGRAEDQRWHVRKNGTRFFADGVLIPLRGEDGMLRGFGKVFRDATLQKQAEEALQKSEAKLHFALKAGRMGTWDLDVETRELTTSPVCKANYGRGPDDAFTYADLANTVLEADAPMWRARVEDAFRRGADFEVEYRVRWPDETVHWVNVRGSCSKSHEGRVVSLSGISSLIDEQKRVEEHLKSADRQKDEFLATASHELRTPLNAILGWARMLRSGMLDQSAYLRGIETIERNAKIQVQLIEDILDGSRMITGKLHLETRPLDFGALLQGAIDVIRPAAEAKNIQLSLVIEPGAAHIVGDADRLQQVVWNLGNNAIKFTPKGGRVEIRLRCVDSNVELSVTDSGQGINPQFLPHVFERFRQAEGSTTRRHGGLGLGLALVRHLAEAHGGTVGAESEGDGRGARFTVTLPRHAVPLAVEAAPPSSPVVAADSAPSSARLRGVSVLVVDDEDDARELVATVLRANGAVVSLASNAAQALELLAQSWPRVLMSDIAMPTTDGYELIRRVRSRTGVRGTTLPAIALTAYAREEDRRRAIAAGFHTHLSKPVEPAELVRVVSGLVNYLDGDQGPADGIEDVGRADVFLKLQRILETQGLRPALRFLNARTSHRFTGLYRFDGPTLRNLALVDAEDLGVARGEDTAMTDSYCSMVAQSERTFTTEDSRRDDRLRSHSARNRVLAYCGVLVRDEAGGNFGTLCHFDVIPCDIPVAEMSLLEAAAPEFMKALAREPDRP